MWLGTLIFTYCLLIVVASLLGGFLPSLIRLTHTRMQVMMSLVSGLMLGVAMLHLLPHAVAFLPSIGRVAGLMLLGLLVMFFLLRVFDVHQHGTVEEEHGHHHKHHHHELSWVGLSFGLAVHTLLDGIALGASVVAEQQHDTVLSLFGFGTFLAVFLHKPLDALSITSLMTAGGWSGHQRAIVNIGFALMCPLGAVLFWLGSLQIADGKNALIGCALAFSAGFFLCIALSDLLPEVRFHRHDRVKLSVALLLGVALALAIEMLPGHSHDPQTQHPAHHGHEHHDH